MPARTTGASGASTGQAILAAAQSAFFSQQHQQPQTLQQHSGKLVFISFITKKIYLIS
jgi:hypothetical protein